MRRRLLRLAWRLGLALTVLGVLMALLAAPVGVKAFTRACDGSLEGLRYLSSVREQLAAATAPPPTPAPQPTATPAPPTPTQRPTMTPAITATAPPTATSTPTATPTPPPPSPTPTGPTLQQRGLEAVGIVGDAALAGLVRVKQADAVAYPLHIVTAHALDAAGCPEDAIRLQWLKAGLHASRTGQPEQVATALVARASAPDQLADLRRVVHTWTLRAHDNEPLKRVFAALN